MRVLPQELMWKARSGRGYIDYFKQKGAEFAIGQILNLIGTSSKNNLITLTKIFEKIAGSGRLGQACSKNEVAF
ncbi:MAG: hypothetical protein MZV70_69935 [Desulfobacterales bacterium]|nr:hypothetical protein [Desulfobacterales bacterium]